VAFAGAAPGFQTNQTNQCQTNHCQTNQCLCVGTHGFANDFGKELEVCGHTETSVGNSYKMEGLATGVPKSLKERTPQDCNVFAIVGKPTVVA
jgi:hypothetical protein